MCCSIGNLKELYSCVVSVISILVMQIFSCKFGLDGKGEKGCGVDFNLPDGG